MSKIRYNYHLINRPTPLNPLVNKGVYRNRLHRSRFENIKNHKKIIKLKST